jgi:hypothetical protein
MKRQWLPAALLLLSSAVHGAPSSEAISEFREAAQRFSEIVHAAEDAKDPALIKGDEARRLIAKLSDEREMLSIKQPKEDDLLLILEICDLSNKALASLATFGIKDGWVQAASDQDNVRKFQASIDQNIKNFEEEFIELQPFVLRCLAKQVGGLEAFIASFSPEKLDDVRKNGVIKMRGGIHMMYMHGYRISEEKQFSDAYRVLLISVLAETAEVFSSILPTSERRQIADTVLSSAIHVPEEYKTHLLEIAKAFSGRECNLICGLE